MTEFNEGQKIRAARPTDTWGGVSLKHGDVLVVGNNRGRQNVGDGYSLVAGPSADNASAYLVDPSDFRVALDGPQWSDVEPGDKVTTRHELTGDEVVLTAFANPSSGSVMVLDSFTAHKGTQTIQGLELLSIEKPKPLPPQTPGSVVRKVVTFGDGFTLFRLSNYYGDKPWVTDNGNRWNDEAVQTSYGTGFEVIYDAGA